MSYGRGSRGQTYKKAKSPQKRIEAEKILEGIIVTHYRDQDRNDKKVFR